MHLLLLSPTYALTGRTQHIYENTLYCEFSWEGPGLLIVWSFQLKFLLDLVFQVCGLCQSLSGDDIDEDLRCCPVSEMSLPATHPLTNLVFG